MRYIPVVLRDNYSPYFCVNYRDEIRPDKVSLLYFAKQLFIRPIKNNLQRFLGRAEAERSEVSTEQSWLQSGRYL